jgi:hypothetical protein
MREPVRCRACRWQCQAALLLLLLLLLLHLDDGFKAELNLVRRLVRWPSWGSSS